MEKLTLKELLKEIKAEKFAEILPYNARKALRAAGLKGMEPDGYLMIKRKKSLRI